MDTVTKHCTLFTLFTSCFPASSVSRTKVNQKFFDPHPHQGFGAMNKNALLQAIKEPFTKAFTVENNKKSFELVGLHPFNPSAIKASEMAPSIPTSTNTISLTDEPSPDEDCLCKPS